MRRLWLLLAILATASLAFATPPPQEGIIKVMTQNLYLGTDLTSLTSVTSPNALLNGVAAQFAQVQQTDFPARAQVIADEIGRENPDLIGLQECVIWSTGPLNQPAQNVEYDFLAILQIALAQRGLPYTVVALVNNSDVQLPGRFGNTLMNVRLQDRDVVLGRTDRGMTFTHAAGVSFLHFPLMRILGQTFLYKQGYCQVDVGINDTSFRFISTHLDPELALDNQLQMWEILRSPANTRMNLILVGDLNSPAAGNSRFAAYQYALLAGFHDGWSAVHPGDPGYTVGHAANLLDPPPVHFTQRIDYTLFKGNILPLNSVLFGLDPTQRTTTDPLPLWPSDHAGVITTFVLP